MTKQELWVDLRGFDDGYEISNIGNIKSYKRFREGQILKMQKDKDGYACLSIRRRGKDITVRVSREVAKH